MKMPIVRTKFEWLISPDSAVTNLDETTQNLLPTPIKMRDGIGTSWITSLLLPLNIVIRRGFHHFKPEMMGQLIPLARFTESYTEPVLAIQSARVGRVILSEDQVGRKFIYGPTGCLFQHVAALDNSPTLDASEDIEVTFLLISDSTVRNLLGEAEAANFLKGLNIQSIPSAAVKKVPRHINGILYSSLADHLTGNIRKLYAQAKVLEYISALAGYVAASSAKTKPVSIKAKAIRYLHEDLIRLKGKVPTLNELAARYGMSAKVLNEEFKRLFGLSIFNFVTEIRLKDAHEALLRTEVPMKTLAANLGYSHVNHFINAFGKKFGYPPGSLRPKIRN